MQRITKTTIAKIDSSTETRDRDIVDAEVRGFGIRIRPNAQPSFYFRYQSPRSKKIRRLSIGLVNDISVEQARLIARQYRQQVAQGLDPENVRHSSSETASMRDLYQRFLEKHVDKRNKPSSQKRTRWLWERYILAQWESWPVKSITRGDVIDLLHEVPSKTVSNRVRSTLSKAFNLAEAWEMRTDGSNPCRHVEKHREDERDRALSPDELRKLWQALDAHETIDHPVVVLAKLILLTGARGGEMRAALLSDIDWDRKLLRLRDSKTGKGEIELTDEALTLIRSAKRLTGCKHVVPGYERGQPLRSHYAAWRRILKTADLGDLRIHDLRHVFGTYADHSGASQKQLMDMLRHTSYQTTQRYVQSFKGARRKGVEQTVRTILGYATGSEEEDPPRP